MPSHRHASRGSLSLPRSSTFQAPPASSPFLFVTEPAEDAAARLRLKDAQAAYDEAAARLARAIEAEKLAAFAALEAAKTALHEAARALRALRQPQA